MHKITFLLTPLFFCAVAVAAVNRGTDDQLHVEAAANVNRLHRVTETTFLMDDVSAAACAPARDFRPHAPHADCYCHVFVNDAGLATIKSGKGKYPKGTVIVKQKFSDPQGTRTELFTLMRKMTDGYDTENGNWEYSIVDRNAKKVLSRGRTDSCIECHDQYAETDYVTRLYIKPHRNEQPNAEAR